MTLLFVLTHDSVQQVLQHVHHVKAGYIQQYMQHVILHCAAYSTLLVSGADADHCLLACRVGPSGRKLWG
jgi:hypothetical protein